MYIDSIHTNNGIDSVIAEREGDFAISKLLRTGEQIREIKVKIKKDYSDYWKHRKEYSVKDILSQAQMAQLSEEADEYERELNEIIDEEYRQEDLKTMTPND